MSKLKFGVDIGGTTVKIGAFSVNGELLDKWEIPTIKENEGLRIFDDVSASIIEYLSKKGLGADACEGIGIGVPGAVDPNGNLVGGAVNLGLKPLNIPAKMNEKFGCKVVAGNDANVAALGEAVAGGAKGKKNVVMVTLGTGVGGGIICGGRLLVGATGGAGELGHVHVEDNETEKCNCGLKGCLEFYTSATGITRLANRRLAKDSAPSVLRGAEISAKTVFDAVKEKDAVACEIAEQFGRYLAKGLGIAACMVNPEVFVIGGGVSKAGDILLDYVRPYFKEYAFPACSNAEFAIATLGNDAGIYGAYGLLED